jgi:hypothetical protein
MSLYCAIFCHLRVLPERVSENPPSPPHNGLNNCYQTIFPWATCTSQTWYPMVQCQHVLHCPRMCEQLHSNLISITAAFTQA